MNDLLRQALVNLAQCMLAAAGGPRGFAQTVEPDDLAAWRQASASGTVEPLAAKQWQPLRTMLGIARKERNLIDNALFQLNFSGDPTQQLTAALLEIGLRPAWLRIRLAVLDALQKNAINLDPFTAQCGFADDQLVCLRDAALLRWLAESLPDGDESALAESLTDADMKAAWGSLDEALDDDRRELLRQSENIQQALAAAHLDVSACLAADVAFSYAAQRRAADDGRSAALAELIAELLLAGTGLQGLWPALDADQLQQALLGHDTALLARTADGKGLMDILLPAIYQQAAQQHIPPRWLDEATARYWRPFAEQVLDANGAERLLREFSLAAALHAAADPDGPPPAAIAAFVHHLRLDEPAATGDADAKTAPDDPFDIGAAKEPTRRDALVAALKQLDQAAFVRALPADAATDLAVEYLRAAPADGQGGLDIAGLGDGDIRAHLLETCRNALTAKASLQARTLAELIIAALEQLPHDGGRMLNSLANAAQVPFDGRGLVRTVLTGEISLFDQIPTTAMLALLNNQGLNTAALDMDARRQELRQALYEELGAALGAAADNHGCALHLVFRRVCGSANDDELLKEYRLTRNDLDRLEADFYAGNSAALAQEIPLRVATPDIPRPTTSERTWRRLRWLFTPLHVWSALVLILVGGYLGLHFHITADPLPKAAPPAVAAAPQWSPEALRAEWPSFRAVTNNAGATLYIAQQPVTYQRYQQIIALTDGDGLAMGSEAGQPIRSVTFEEAAEFCRRWSDLARARHPEAFREAMADYVFRLPTAAEAAMAPLPSAPARPHWAEWVVPTAAMPAELAQVHEGWLAGRPARLVNGEIVYRALPENVTTFRVVFGPPLSDAE